MNIRSSLTLPENKASHIINRLPNPQHFPKLPDRDGSIPLDVQDQVFLIPPYSALVLTDKDTSIQEAPIRVFLDSTGDSYVTWCLEDHRYVAYTHEELTNLLTKDDAKIVLN